MTAYAIINYDKISAERRKKKAIDRRLRLKPYYASVLELIEICGGTQAGYGLNGYIGVLAGQLAMELYTQIYQTNIHSLPPEEVKYPLVSLTKCELGAVKDALRASGQGGLIDRLNGIHPIVEPTAMRGGAVK